MATYRPVYINLWQDDDVLEFTPEEKFFFLYIMTNSKTTQCGLYKFSKKVTSFETGYNIDTITKYINVFVEKEKIAYDPVTEEILILKWLKYNPIDNRNMQKCVNKELTGIKSLMLLKKFNELVQRYVKKEEYYPVIEQLKNEVTKPLVSPLEDPCKEETESETESTSKDDDVVDEVKTIIRFFEDNFYLPKSYDAEVLTSWCSIYPTQLIIPAMKIARKNNGRTLTYIERILMNWKQDGINTVSALESYLQTGGKLNGGNREHSKQESSSAYEGIRLKMSDLQ